MCESEFRPSGIILASRMLTKSGVDLNRIAASDKPYEPLRTGEAIREGRRQRFGRLAILIER